MIVKISRKQDDGFKAKALMVLTGDVKVEMLEVPTVGCKTRPQKFKFLQVSKVTTEDAKPEPENKEGKKQKKSKELQSLNEWFKEAADGDL